MAVSLVSLLLPSLLKLAVHLSPSGPRSKTGHPEKRISKPQQSQLETPKAQLGTTKNTTGNPTKHTQLETQTSTIPSPKKHNCAFQTEEHNSKAAKTSRLAAVQFRLRSWNSIF